MKSKIKRSLNISLICLKKNWYLYLFLIFFELFAIGFLIGSELIFRSPNDFSFAYEEFTLGTFTFTGLQILLFMDCFIVMFAICRTYVSIWVFVFNLIMQSRRKIVEDYDRQVESKNE